MQSKLLGFFCTTDAFIQFNPLRMNPHAVPYLRFLIPFAIGVAWGGCVDAPIPRLGLGLLLATLVAVWLANQKFSYRYRWVFGGYIHLLLLLGGYWLTVRHNEIRQPDHFSAFAANGRYFVGTVYEAPSKGAKSKVPLRVEAIGYSPDSMRPVTGNLLVFLDLTPDTDSIRYGDRLGFRATARATEPPKNPHAFDYKRYLHFQNIHFQAFVKPDSLVRLSSGNGYALWRGAYGCRDRLLTLLRQHFPTQDEYAVASALLVGYKDDLSEDLRAAYAETGSMHALAVSGTHVGMLYVGLMFLMGLFKFRGRWKLLEAALILLAIWGFTFLTGATASVLRASVMFSTYLLGKVFWREASAWNVLPASAFGLLLYNPYFLFDVGFQLSYAAVAGMVFFYPRVYRLLPPMPRWQDECAKVLLVGFAAQLGTLPLTLYYFNQFPTYFWLAGWIVVFGGAVFLWGGVVLVFLDAFVPTLGDWVGTALYYMVFWMNKIIFFIQSLPGSVVRNIWVSGWAVAALFACVGLLGATMVYRRGEYIAAFCGVMALLGAYRITTLWEKQTQRTIVVYHVNKQRLIDFFDGDCAISLMDSLTRKQENFSAQANRTASGIRTHQAMNFAETAPAFSANLLVDLPFVQFFKEKMALVDDPRWVESGRAQPVPVDVLLLSKSPKVSVAACRERFPCQIVVFDASNTWRQIERWKKECEAEGWAYHDVRSQGAWECRQ